MKTNFFTRTTLLAAASFLFAFATTTSAQVSVQTELPMLVANNNISAMSPAKSALVAKTAISISLREQAEQFCTITTKSILPALGSTLNDIQNGGTKTIGASVSAKANQSIGSRNTIKVRVSYEPRPIGGILNVQVDLVPQFAGVGVAARPIASKTMATAVDRLDNVTVTALVASLSADLAAEVGQTNIH